MKSSHYFAIVVRLFAIALFLYELRRSSLFIELLITGSLSEMEVSLIFLALTTFIPMLAAVLLWYFPMTVSQFIVKPELDYQVEKLGAHSMLTILVLALGLYAFYSALIDTSYWALFLYMFNSQEGAIVPLSMDNKSNVWTTAVEFFVSLAIILKARSIAKKMLEVAT